MAFKAQAQWTRGGRTEEVHATLGRYAITLSPEADGRLPYSDITEVWQYGTYIHIRYMDGGSGGECRLDMLDPRRARRFARKMEDAPSPLEAIGAKPGDAVAVIGLPDTWVVRLLRRRRVKPTENAPSGVDILVVGVSDEASLSTIATCTPMVRQGGALWVVYPRGHREVGTDAVVEAGRAVGLKGELELQVSSRHSAMKLVAPQPMLVAAAPAPL